tara:strand:+ start:620 stop:859 length:240 start_codon:yes stop_codon:yes gene_type:complete
MTLLEQIIEEIEDLGHIYTDEIDKDTLLKEDLGFSREKILLVIENIEFRLDVNLDPIENNFDNNSATVNDVLEAIIKER